MDAAVPPHPVRRVDVEAPVVVEIRRDRAPVPARAAGAGARRRVLEAALRRLKEERVAAAHLLHPRDGDGFEDASRQGNGQAGVLVEEAPLRVRARRVEVHPAVAVEVAPRGGHPVAAVLDSELRRHVLEALPVDVPVEVLQAEVVRHDEVGAAVAVEVGEEARERPARGLRDTPFGRRVAEMALPVPEEQSVPPPVVRVERRVGHLSVVVAGAADEEVEVAVAVHVRERERARGARRDDARRGGDLLERAVAAVPEEARRPERVRHREVREAVAVHVTGRDAGRGDSGESGRGETRALGHVGEMPVPVVAVEDRADAVADEEVLGAVPVEVEDGDARARPDAVDEAVRELLRRVAARSAEARRERRVVEARIQLASLGDRREKIC